MKHIYLDEEYPNLVGNMSINDLQQIESRINKSLYDKYKSTGQKPASGTSDKMFREELERLNEYFKGNGELRID